MKPSRLATSGGVRPHTGRGMKKISKAALLSGAAGAAIAATVGAAAPAQADTGQFVYAVNAIGIYSDDGWSGIANVGWQICSDLAYGYSPDSIAGSLFGQSHAYQGYYNSITYTQALSEVNLAMAYLCPGNAVMA